MGVWSVWLAQTGDKQTDDCNYNAETKRVFLVSESSY